jgi:hypothetical protein
MVVQPYIVKAEIVFREKRLVLNPETGQSAVVEIKIWAVPESRI